MSEQKELIIEIDRKRGKIDLNTNGLKGEGCLEEAKKILEGIVDIQEIEKTSEYYETENFEQKELN